MTVHSMRSRPSQDSSHSGSSVLKSHGRGGAGNIVPDSTTPIPATAAAHHLTAPTIKSSTYTTGRGGTGNMATNDPTRPELAREAQDVDAPCYWPRERNVAEEVHFGRGGAANVTRPGSVGDDGDSRQGFVGPVKADVRGWADKGKDLLMGRRKK
ncbi:MAG: hypothetical protein M1833_006464 [Piccolia ochrophora]|nr:MAG: hypothetical protein M1833_006464 [Piccolia ochrophora]